MPYMTNTSFSTKTVLLPRDWKDPIWTEAEKVHDWKNYISEELREIWHTFNDAQKKAITASAQVQADAEKWE